MNSLFKDGTERLWNKPIVFSSDRKSIFATSRDNEKMVDVIEFPFIQPPELFIQQREIIDDVKVTKDRNYVVTYAQESSTNKQIRSIAHVWGGKTGTLRNDISANDITITNQAINDEYYYIPYRNQVLRLPVYIQPYECERRKRLMADNPHWHFNQSIMYEYQSNWFAAAFHLRRLAALEPADAAVKARLAAAEMKILPREAAPLPHTSK